MKLRAIISIACLLAATPVGLFAETVGAPRVTTTPIEHLIVVVGENISFDNLFATYEPPAGETVGNLLSRGIVDRDGKPGPHFADAAQREASVRDAITVTPATTGTYATLPQPGTTYANGPAALRARYALSGRSAERAVPDHALCRLRTRRSAIRCTASSRCGSRSTAARRISSPGSQ